MNTVSVPYEIVYTNELTKDEKFLYIVLAGICQAQGNGVFYCDPKDLVRIAGYTDLTLGSIFIAFFIRLHIFGYIHLKDHETQGAYDAETALLDGLLTRRTWLITITDKPLHTEEEAPVL